MNPEQALASRFRGNIPQKYQRKAIKQLDSNTLRTFSTTLGSRQPLNPDQLIRVLYYLNALTPEEHVFAVFDDVMGKVQLYSFDLQTTPYSQLILDTYERLRSNGDLEKSLDFLIALLNLTAEYTHLGLDKDPEFTEGALAEVRKHLKQDVSREELGVWKAVSSPYNNIHTGLYY